MDDRSTPGLANQSTVRTAARVGSVVLLVAGVVLLVRGISAFASEMENPSLSDGPGSVLTAAAGGFCVVLGLAAASVGWMGAHASYVAGETMPVVKSSLEHLRADGASAPATGPYCRRCGTRNDADARFCDSCGQSVA